MIDMNGSQHACTGCGETHEHDWEQQQKDLEALDQCVHTTLEQQMEYYRKYRFTRAHDLNLTYQAIANVFWDGDAQLALLADIAASLGSWSHATKRVGDNQDEMIKLLKKSMDGGEEWQGDCDCGK